MENETEKEKGNKMNGGTIFVLVLMGIMVLGIIAGILNRFFGKK